MIICGDIALDLDGVIVYFFFFKQKTAYEMRISDWSSDVCSSDLKGVGEKAMEILVVERDGQGSFQSFDDFANRVEPRLLNRLQLESLTAGGAFDSIKLARARVPAAAAIMLAMSARAADALTSGQGGVCGLVAVKQHDIPNSNDV